ncbi:hypothetical protein ADK70_12485 [Streptomyces rimosus subsp. pseudoverticillatus]|uniref:hypothetical protein n=1 Tax=Streptomyces rimosus TaxID=1927 RepID=UPI0006B29E54|nr:hypothetical protein [Streptomyces rimosus]KOT94490.1 hypothetical protein ADK70_12485 [Streptomyces rimosus subsp. pseudoverticillatus]
MSSVTHMFIIVGDTADDAAEDVAPRVADAIAAFIPEAGALPVISNQHDAWESLQGGTKPGGGAVIWVAWNYARPRDLESHLREQGFENITVWSQHELQGLPPRVTSW